MAEPYTDEEMKDLIHNDRRIGRLLATVARIQADRDRLREAWQTWRNFDSEAPGHPEREAAWAHLFAVMEEKPE